MLFASCYTISVGTVPMFEMMMEQGAAGGEDGKCISQDI